MWIAIVYTNVGKAYVTATNALTYTRERAYHFPSYDAALDAATEASFVYESIGAEYDATAANLSNYPYSDTFS